MTSKKSTAIIEIKNISKKLDKKPILQEVSLCVQEGEIFGFLGPNGAGKTTTMKCILRLISPDTGEIRILGKTDFDNAVKQEIGFMPENTYLYKYLSGREFLRFNGNFFNIEKKELEARIEDLLKKVGLEHAADRKLSKYSKGMLQRIGLAQSIINEPKIVFFDEPMSGLDPLGRKMVKDLMLELKKKGTTVFFNTHILSDVEALCEHFAIIHRGKIVANMHTKDLQEPLEDFFVRTIEENAEGMHEII